MGRALLLALLLLPASARAQGRGLNFQAGLRAPNKESRIGVYLEGSYLFLLGQYFSAGPWAGFSRSETKVHTLSKGGIIMVPVGAKLRYETVGTTSLFIDLNAGWFFMTHAVDEDYQNEQEARGLRISEGISSTPGAVVGGGGNYAFSSNNQLGFYLGAMLVNPNSETRVTTIATQAVASKKERVNFTSPILTLSYTHKF
jgi:hypothetical protein